MDAGFVQDYIVFSISVHTCLFRTFLDNTMMDYVADKEEPKNQLISGYKYSPEARNVHDSFIYIPKVQTVISLMRGQPIAGVDRWI